MVARNFHTDFSEYAAGAKPTGWTRRWVSSPGDWKIVANSGKGGAKNGLQMSGLTAVRNSMSWDVIDPADPDSADIDILARWKSSNATGNYDARFMVRGSGGSGTENGYQGGIGNGFRRSDKYVAGVSGVVGSSSPAALTVAAETFAFTRFRINGSTISTRSWLDDDGVTLETDAPLYSWTNTEVTGPGWAGVFQSIVNGLTTFDELAIATGGLVATFTNTVDKEITDTLGLTDPGSSLSVSHNIVVTDGIGISDARVSDLVSQFNIIITDRLNATDSRLVGGSTTTNLTIVDSMDLIDDALIQTLIPGGDTGEPSDVLIARGTDIIEELIAAGFTVGSIMDRERARLLAKTGASPVGNTLQDLYFLANERPRL